MSYTDCQNAITNSFNTIDLNKDGVVSMCEDAKFLVGIGNTVDYAKTYPGSYSLSDVKGMCDWIVPDGFDQKPVTEVNFLKDFINMWPLSLFTKDLDIPGLTS